MHGVRSTTASRARRLFVGSLVFVVVVALLLATSARWSWLGVLGVPTENHPYADARTISGAGIALERGLDPLTNNPGDPWGRTMDYPRVWLLFARLGFGPQQNTLLVVLFWGSALIGALALLRLVNDRRTAIVMSLGLLAPTTWLALERANNDLLLFGLGCVGALMATRRVATSAGLIGLAALLKLYPIAGVAALLRPDGPASRRWLVPLLALFAVYVAVTFSDVLAMRAGAARAEFLSYGIDIVPTWLGKNTALNRRGWHVIAVLVLCGVTAMAFVARRRSRLDDEPTPSLAAFRLGAATYLGTFAIGANFDYRLLFLLPALPQLSRWTACRPVRTLATDAIVTILLLLWSMTWRKVLKPWTGSTLPLAIDEMLGWAAWFLLATLFVRTLPEWLLPSRWRGVPLLDAAPPAPVLAITPSIVVPRRPRRTGG